MYCQYRGKTTRIIFGIIICLLFMKALDITYNKAHINDNSWDEHAAKIIEEKLNQSVPSQKAFNELLTKYKNEYKEAILCTSFCSQASTLLRIIK